MIPRAHRFHGYNSLRSVYRNGRTVRGASFALKVLHNPRRKSYRAAVVVSRKVSKSAVARNRMRRRLYELIREFDEDISEPCDIVVTVYQDSLLDVPYKQLRSQLKRQLQDAGAIQKAPAK